MSEGVKLGVGEIISGTLSALAARPLPYILYALALAGLGTAFDQYAPAVSASVPNIIGIITGYAFLRFLFEADGMGGSRTFGAGLASYFGAAFLSGLGMILGLILLVVPGLILAARWSIATGLVLRDDAHASDSLKRSWELTRASQWSLVGAYCVFGLVAIALLALLGGGAGYLGTDDGLDEELSFGLNFAINVAVQVIGVIGFAAVLFLTRRLAPSRGELEQVFS